MPSDTSPRGHETVTAFFDTRTEADAALERLRHAAFPVEAVRIHEGTAATETDREASHKGFWETLGDLFLPGEDRGTYADALTRGGTLLSVSVASADRARVLDILDRDDPVDPGERGDSWSGEGWGGPATSPVFGDAGLTATRNPEAVRPSPTADAGLRSGISGIGARAAGAPPARFERRDEDSALPNAVEVEVEDRPTDRRRSKTAGASALLR